MLFINENDIKVLIEPKLKVKLAVSAILDDFYFQTKIIKKI